MTNLTAEHFKSPGAARRFKQVFGAYSRVVVTQTADQVTSTFHPVDLFHLEQALHRKGFRYCPTTKAIICHLATTPEARFRVVVYL